MIREMGLAALCWAASDGRLQEGDCAAGPPSRRNIVAYPVRELITTPRSSPAASTPSTPSRSRPASGVSDVGTFVKARKSRRTTCWRLSSRTPMTPHSRRRGPWPSRKPISESRGSPYPAETSGIAASHSRSTRTAPNSNRPTPASSSRGEPLTARLNYDWTSSVADQRPHQPAHGRPGQRRGRGRHRRRQRYDHHHGRVPRSGVRLLRHRRTHHAAAGAPLPADEGPGAVEDNPAKNQ